MQPGRQQAAAEVEALGKAVRESGVEHQLAATFSSGDAFDLGQHALACTAAAHRAGGDQIVDIDEIAMDEVVHSPIARDGDGSAALPCDEKAPTLETLYTHAVEEGLWRRELRPQLAHHGMAGQKLGIRLGMAQSALRGSH